VDELKFIVELNSERMTLKDPDDGSISDNCELVK